MGKSSSASIAKTPASIAKDYAKLSAKKKELESQLAELKADIVGMYEEDPYTNFEYVEVQKRVGKPTLIIEGGPKMKERVIEKLKAEAPDYTIEEVRLDLERIFIDLPNDSSLRNCLAANGVTIDCPSVWAIKVS